MSVVRIAKHAGVSIATVSRVMTNSRRVQPEIAAKVRLAIEELGLPVRQVRHRERRHEVASRAAKTIGIITLVQECRAWLTDPVIGSVVAEISKAAADQHLGVLLAEMLDPKKLCRVVEQGQVDGALVLIPSWVDPAVADTLVRRVPTVRVMGGQIGPLIADQVCPDHMSVGVMAANYLIEKGCKDLAFLTLTPDWAFCQIRAHGFFSAIDGHFGRGAAINGKAYFAAPERSMRFSYGDFAVSHPDWAQVMKRFAADKPTGLYVTREAELSQVCRMLNEQGIKPGRDIAVISCDNSQTWLSSLDFRPATMDMRLADVARTAVARLISRMEHPNEPLLRMLIDPVLVPVPVTEQYGLDRLTSPTTGNR